MGVGLHITSRHPGGGVITANSSSSDSAIGSDVNKAKSVEAETTTPRLRPQTPKPQPHVSAALPVPERIADESTVKKLSNTRNLVNNGEQSLSCYSVMGHHSQT